MNLTSMGDLAQHYQLRRQGVELRQHLARLTEEVASGRHADMGAAVSGDFTALAGIDRSLRTLEGYKLATDEARLLTGTLQTAFGTLQDQAEGFGVLLQSAATTAETAQIAALGTDARQRLEAAVSALNLRAADRYALSGTATDTAPLADADTILSALQAATAAEVSATGVASAVAAWFDAPAGGGGYLDTAYLGADTALAPLRIGEGDSAAMALTAADPRLRDMLQGLALAALLDRGALAGNAIERGRLANLAGAEVLSAEGGIADLRAELGTTEGRIADTATRNAAEAAALQVARTRIVEADPYEAASALEAVQTQLESLYTITARIAHLSLTDYL